MSYALILLLSSISFLGFLSSYIYRAKLRNPCGCVRENTDHWFFKITKLTTRFPNFQRSWVERGPLALEIAAALPKFFST